MGFCSAFEIWGGLKAQMKAIIIESRVFKMDDVRKMGTF